MLHVDTSARDSLACDLMEPVRPQVDAYLLDWITRQPLRWEWLFEKGDGNCRLSGSLAVRLSETAQLGDGPLLQSQSGPLASFGRRYGDPTLHLQRG
jgi:CRISPR/Cas system-associated endonuclease Cas1